MSFRLFNSNLMPDINKLQGLTQQQLEFGVFADWLFAEYYYTELITLYFVLGNELR